jgi:hypothetical protein
MSRGSLAYIFLIDQGPTDPGFGVPGWPAHPIAPGGPPPYPSHPIPPTVWPNPPGQGPGNPPGFWGGSAPWPGYPMPPMAPGGPPPHPSHPIPPGVWPSPPGGGGGGGGGGSPPGIWGGGNEPFPTPPIFIPPGLPPVDQPEGPIEWKTAWSPQTGWVVVGVPSEGTEHPTPSK